MIRPFSSELANTWRAVDKDGNWEKQALRTSRFYDRDWARIEMHTVMRGMTAGKLVRTAAIAAVGKGPQ